jgi:phosphatidate cytidylyltransferase
MLRQRVITAVLLLALLVPALLASQAWPFALLTLLLIGAAGWEWGRLNQASPPLAVAMGLALAGACGFSLMAGQHQSPPPGLWWAAAAGWLVAGTFALRAGVVAWPRLRLNLRWLIGLAALWLAWLAISHAQVRGGNFILSVFSVVWMADVAAYFGGRAFGRRKLAPTISPGKSWEGVYSGMVGVVLLAAVWLAVEPAGADHSLFYLLQARWGLVGMVICLVGLCGVSVMGDLIESLVKRAAGAKDSSRLLPGHGGVLDRIDALLPAFPVALALIG